MLRVAGGVGVCGLCEVQSPRSKVQSRGGAGHASRITHHGSRFTFLSPVAALLRAEPDEQVDVGDAALRAAAARLLAAAPPFLSINPPIHPSTHPLLRSTPPSGFGEAAVPRAGGGGERGDLPGAAEGQLDLERVAVGGPGGQCAGVLLALPGEYILAGGFELVLPAPGAVAGGDGGGSGGSGGGHYAGGAVAGPAAAVSARGLVVVPGDAGAGAGVGAGRRAGDGRPLYVLAVGGRGGDGDLGRGECARGRRGAGWR